MACVLRDARLSGALGTLLKDGIRGRDRPDEVVDAWYVWAASALAAEELVGLCRVDPDPDGIRLCPLGLATVVAGAFGAAAGRFVPPTPMFQTLRTRDLAEARSPTRRGLAILFTSANNKCGRPIPDSRGGVA